jgi:DNA repair protein RadC
LKNLKMKEKTTFYSIKNWSEADRPREKLVSKGCHGLSDSELLAILLGTGSKSESAVDLAKRILLSVDNNLNVLGKLSVKNLQNFKGIGEAKAVTIAAALELGKRRSSQENPDKARISSSTSAYNFLHPIIGELPHEEFWVLYLNNSNKVLKPFQASKGGITGTLVDVRIVLRQALELGATSIILAHNHPSGTLKPSESDKKLTQKLKTACQSLDIKILDHIIVTEKAYFSFADQGLI